jgi:outer membrane protein assembly factor BamD
MLRRIHLIAVLGVLLALTAACTNKKSINPLAGVGSKQPDKVLFDKAMEAMRHNRFDVARLTLQTLINTYPDSEYIARAKLAVGDSWYAEGGTAALAQAEQEYSDFEIFFPNLKEAAEAQLKIANIHYQQMEKSDRDYTHAKRAEDEYRKVILQYPESKLIPDAKKRLLEVQEVLADREFGIGRFYYLRESYAASIARLQSLVEKYPLYSHADEALYLLGQNYEGQIERIRKSPTCDVHNLPRGCMREADKAHAIGELSKTAATKYSTIVTRYPLMDRADDAKKRLEALHEPVPRPTKAAVARNKAEIESRGQATMMKRAMGLIKKGPDVSQAAQVGEPSLVETEPISAVTVQKEEARAFVEASGGGGGNKVGVELINPNQPANAAPPADGSAPNTNPFGVPAAGATPPGSATPDPNELKPTAPSDPNELKPADSGADASPPPPTQVNEIQNQSSSSNATKADDSTPASDQDLSSSKKKKKKGLQKINPF